MESIIHGFSLTELLILSKDGGEFTLFLFVLFDKVYYSRYYADVRSGKQLCAALVAARAPRRS